jgi:hypothetical protein
MSNTFFEGQTDYIKKLNLLALYSNVSQVPINTTNALLGWSYAQAFAAALGFMFLWPNTRREAFAEHIKEIK